mmetsp:Transcript_17947/g.41872  ORF Transcript_17947/g.41872 Transcript_17947/m.41872 type:complete len:793 (+) Transcript_17947:107-2485(+)|eukprot:CAMPEP_0178390422 /NCGR_PEP_ID=MMETSP0689_2-20121128/10639_1 /TAXON_ID=160604 /ORGANISM="Amphidinium massartii, Strain CS-259" /LENGTH=792 /DNA_ID=CAMNT_0020010933 /DNA_START=9 /DNA_END=2387 /DNA_ORIENTATION=-
MRIFIHGVNTYLGKVLVQELRKAEGGFHRVFGTAVGDRSGVPATVKRLVSRDDPKKSKKMIETIQSCRLVVVDLQNCTLDDLHFIIAALKVDSKASPPRPTGELETDVTFVLISSLMVWAETKIEVPKAEALPAADSAEAAADAEAEAAAGEDGEEGEAEQTEAQEPAAEEDEKPAADEEAAQAEDGEGEDDEEKPPPPVVRPEGLIRDSDFRARVPLKGSRYESWRDMEELVMNCFNREESKVKAFITAGGVFYGCGEETFAQLFKDAWLGVLEPAAGDSDNHVPTVHIKDMARLVRAVGFDTELNPLEQPYFIGVDQPPVSEGPAGFPKPPTKAQLLQGLIDELSGKPVQQDSQTAKPAGGVNPALGTADRPPAPAETTSTFVSKFHSKDKFSESKGKPIELDEALNLNLWVEASSKMLAEGFAEDCEPAGWFSKPGLVSNVASVAAEFTAERQLRAMKVIVSGPPASGKTTLAASIAAHFNIPHLDLGSRSMDECIAAINSKVCHYRGYVLECQGHGHDEMDTLFRYDKEVEPDEDEEEEEEPPPPEDEEEEGEEPRERPPKPKPTVRTLSETLCPEFAIVLQAPEPFCRARWQGAGNRGSLDDFASTYQQYAEANLTEGSDCFADFFQEIAKIPVLNLPVMGKDQEDIVESARIYMERSGRPFNYLKPGEEVASAILAKRAERDEEEAQRAAAEGDLAQQKEGAARQGESWRQAERLKVIEQHIEKRQEVEGMPLRDFLMKYAVTHLTEGLIEMCKVLPEDPVDYLANYLDNCAANVADAEAAAAEAK